MQNYPIVFALSSQLSFLALQQNIEEWNLPAYNYQDDSIEQKK